MCKKKKFLAIIPARGGSKRLPGKNTLDLSGKPLISYTIESAIKSKYIDKVLVTSDDAKVLDIANSYNVSSIRRPKNLASDVATSTDVIKHALSQMPGYEFIILLQPTSPLRDFTHIDEAINSLIQKKADSIISVSKMEHNPQWSDVLDKDLSMDHFAKKIELGKRSQQLDSYYVVNGAIYICRSSRLIKDNTLFFKDKSYAYKMKREFSIDIDTYTDFIIANCFMDKIL